MSMSWWVCLQGLPLPLLRHMRCPPINLSLPYHSPLSVAPPTGGDVGVANEGEEEGVYDNIPGDQLSHDM